MALTITAIIFIGALFSVGTGYAISVYIDKLFEDS